MNFQIVDRQMIINQLEAIKILESTIRNEVIEAQVWAIPKATSSLMVIQTQPFLFLKSMSWKDMDPTYNGFQRI